MTCHHIQLRRSSGAFGLNFRHQPREIHSFPLMVHCVFCKSRSLQMTPVLASQRSLISLSCTEPDWLRNARVHKCLCTTCFALPDFTLNREHKQQRPGSGGMGSCPCPWLCWLLVQVIMNFSCTTAQMSQLSRLAAEELMFIMEFCMDNVERPAMLSFPLCEWKHGIGGHVFSASQMHLQMDDQSRCMHLSIWKENVIFFFLRLTWRNRRMSSRATLMKPPKQGIFGGHFQNKVKLA